MMWRTAAVALTLVPITSGAIAAGASREIMVSANDGKPVRLGDTAADVTADSLSVLEVTDAGIRVLGTVDVPASMVGPPDSVKIVPDGRLAIVTGGQRVGGTQSPLVVPGDTVSLIDLAVPAQPRVVQQVTAGLGAAGVAVDRRGRMVLVANSVADTISVFRLADGRLSLVNTIALPAGSKPVSARFARDGRSAIVAGATAGRIFRLSLEDGRMVATGESIATGHVPFGMSTAPDGRTVYVANVEGATGGTGAVGTLSIIDAARFRQTGTVPLGNLPESIAVSPSGRYLQVTLVNGSQLATDAPGYAPGGLMRVLRLSGGGATQVAEIATPALCQGAAWSRDERHIVLQCAGPRTIIAYDFDGKALTLNASAPLTLEARPGAMASRSTR